MKKIFTLIVMLAATLGMQAQDVWSVVGTQALTGTNWGDDWEAVTSLGNGYRLYRRISLRGRPGPRYGPLQATGFRTDGR